ncbi:MAG: flagellar motor protein MotB [Polaromonas sp.]|uniref:flagellar motor protein MotB n=1 Tax=Polaromonas sp. TaxID=1869339 RepID=UPI002489AD3F|nr:flagellar motor protein MotB [Polaromonas sp.]MDI1268715.1 flagellar motor protein MotB [Polaromonas sp.]
MSDAGGKRPIIIIRRPVMAAAHHGGAWKIAFADFMTAMFAFFLVMWLLSTSSPKQLAGIAEQFKMPLAVAVSGGKKSSTSTSVIPGGGADPTSRIDGEVSKSDEESANDPNDGRRLDDLKKRLDDMIESSPVLKQFRPQLLIDITPEGLRIQIVDSSNRPMFDRSSAVVASYMRTILRELGPVLNEQPSKLTLSGHTDSTAYTQGDKSYSNWELSADRANASRRELLAGGMQDTKVLRVVGVSSSVHLNKDDPYAPVNRRISIVVLNRRAQADIENANAVPSDAAALKQVSVRPDGGKQTAVPPTALKPGSRI